MSKIEVNSIKINNIKYYLGDYVDMKTFIYRTETFQIYNILIVDGHVRIGIRTLTGELMFGSIDDVLKLNIKHTSNPLYIKKIRLRKLKNIFNQ